MKKLFTLLFLLPFFVMAQKTYVPDDNFEQALINLGYDNILDDSVLTANISIQPILDVSSSNISDLTGIEDFTALLYLSCDWNNLTSIDVSNNTNLISLSLDYNQITSIILNLPNLEHLAIGLNPLSSLDVTSLPSLKNLLVWSTLVSTLNLMGNPLLEGISVSSSPLYSLDFSYNPLLREIYCSFNQFSNLDVSNLTHLEVLRCSDNNIDTLLLNNNTSLTVLDAQNNNLEYLDLRNGNNYVMLDSLYFNIINNPNLSCINVDDSTYSVTNWTHIDTQHTFSNNCNPLLTICDSVSITLNPSTTTVNYSTNNTLQNSTISQVWTITELVSNSIVLTDTASNPSFTLNMADTFIVCVDYSIQYQGGIYSCNICDTILHDGTSWLLMSMAQPTAITEQSQNKTLLKITYILGRKSKGIKNTPLFYIYDDGTVEKKIIIE